MFLTVLVSSDYDKKTPHTGWLKQQTIVSRSSRDWKSKTKVPANLVPKEGPLPGWQVVTCVPTWWRVCPGVSFPS